MYVYDYTILNIDSLKKMYSNEKYIFAVEVSSNESINFLRIADIPYHIKCELYYEI